GCHQMNRKTDTGKTLKRWPVFVDHYIISSSLFPRKEHYHYCSVQRNKFRYVFANCEGKDGGGKEEE
ncbi:hypothetical protein, partial [Escherichia coli]|uniref:hypothetical protein n=1 Tax=Escherichia coli TaxID=562 RepID=UPI003CCC37AE